MRSWSGPGSWGVPFWCRMTRWCASCSSQSSTQREPRPARQDRYRSVHARTAGAADQDPSALLGRQLAERCGEGLDVIGSVINARFALVMRENEAS
jgi:hypothetical protein